MKRLELLDCGRFVAALCVMAFHYFFNGIHNGKISSITYFSSVVDFAKYGYLGVEFFFMISGYVIFFSANHKTASEFAVTRAVRLYPAFWIAVLFTSIVSQFWGGSLMTVRASQVLANLTMFPELFRYDFVDGVYWTLQYELSFYLAVLACLIFGLHDKLRVIFLLWPVAMALASALDKQWLPYLGGYYAYFAAGSIFAINKEHPSKASAISLLVCLYLCITFSAGGAAELSTSKGTAYSPLVIGTIIFSQFAFFIALNSTFGSSLKIAGSRLAGGLTYPIYLIHAHFGYMVISRFASMQNRALIYALTIFIVIFLSYLIHIFAERRLASTWKALFASSLGAGLDKLQRQGRKLALLWRNQVNRI